MGVPQVSDGPVKGAGSSDWRGRSLHLVGIGGAGMNGLARIALELGAEVSGSDSTDSHVVAELRALGARVTVGHSAEAVPDGSQLVYSGAVSDDNPERVRATELGLAQLHRSELLAELTRMRPTISVTGTHGKTTTTAMVLAAMRGTGLDPGWVVGSSLAGGQPGAGWGTSDLLVVEADESDRSLLTLDSDIGIITNCELDHHSTYRSLEDLEATLTAFAADLTHAVVWDRPALLALVPDGVGLTPYDAPGAASGPGGTTFEWRGRSVCLRVPGVHNAVNAAGALEAAVLAGADPDLAVDGITSFAGTGRRFERRGETASGAVVIDDYAHHPTEVAATIAAARSLSPGRVVAVFQPHLFSRTEAFVDEFAEALSAADRVFVADIYPARESAADFPGIDSSLIVAAVNRISGGAQATAAGGLEEAEREVAAELASGDICLLMGAGDVNSLAEGLLR